MCFPWLPVKAALWISNVGFLLKPFLRRIK
jgi:hypothetical protein